MGAGSGRCPSCGEAVSQTDSDCGSCGFKIVSAVQSSGSVFLFLVLFLIAGFAFTGFIVRGYKARQQQLAQRWFSRGEQALSTGASLQAVDDFQTALAYARENDAFRLKLALALMQSGQIDEARVHLVNLWETRPGDATVNLQLARAMAKLGHSEDAVRFYHGAIYGVWDSDPLEKRQEARFELAKYLLATRQTNAAESELIALAAESPTRSESEIKLGDLFMDAGDPARALSAYLHGRRGPRDATADLGASRAAFALHDFRKARDYARQAAQADPKLEDASALAERAEAVLKADPNASGLSSTERARRAYEAYAAASARLSGCGTSDPDAHVQELGSTAQEFKRLNEAVLRRDPDLLSRVVRWSYGVEIATESRCSAPEGLDATLLMLAHYERPQ